MEADRVPVAAIHNRRRQFGVVAPAVLLAGGACATAALTASPESIPAETASCNNATVGRGFGTTSPEPGDLVFFFRSYFDAGQDWTHVGVVSRIDSNGTVWMIDAPGARAAGDPPDAPFGRVRDEPIAGSWLQHRPTYARIPDQ